MLHYWWLKNKNWKRHILGCKNFGTLYFKNALIVFFLKILPTISTLEDFNRLLLDVEKIPNLQISCHYYSVAMEVAMSTKQTLKLNMLFQFVAFSYMYMHYSQSYVASNMKGWNLEKWVGGSLTDVSVRTWSKLCEWACYWVFFTLSVFSLMMIFLLLFSFQCNKSVRKEVLPNMW